MPADTALARAQAGRALVPVLVLIGLVTSVVSSLGAPLLPTISRADHVSLGEAQWSLTITMLVGAVTAPVLGRLGDGPRRRSVIVGSLAAVVLGSALAALPAGGFTLLLLGRGLQGTGLGLMPLTMAVARDSLPEDRSAPAIALLSIATAAGVGLGYPITGLLDEHLGLHSCFWFGAVVGSVALALSLPVIPDGRHLPRRTLDSTGALLLGLALVALLVGVTEGPAWGWGSVGVVGLLIGAAVLGAAWVVRERAVEHPLVQLGLLRNVTVAGTNVVALLVAMAMYLFLPLLTDFVQTPTAAGYGFGASVVTTGLMLLPFSVMSTSASRVAAVLGARHGREWVVAAGCVVTAAAVGMFALGGGALWEGFVDMGLCGTGVGFTFAAMPGLIVGSVPLDETGSALGFYQVVRFVGFSLGSGLGASVLAGFTRTGRALPDRAGFTVALTIGAGIALLAAAVSTGLGRHRRRASVVPMSSGSATRPFVHGTPRDGDLVDTV